MLEVAVVNRIRTRSRVIFPRFKNFLTAEEVTGERSKGKETGETGGIRESLEVSKGSEENDLVEQKALAVSLEKEGRIFWNQMQMKRNQSSICSRMTTRRYYKVLLGREQISSRYCDSLINKIM